MTDEELIAIAKAASELNWSVDEYGTVITPDKRTAEMNGFATICGYGEAQKASKARAAMIVRMTQLFPDLLERAQAAEARARTAEEATKQEYANGWRDGRNSMTEGEP